MPSAAPRWTFGPFVLDPANVCLWRGTQAVALSPKVFAVLHYLVTHPDRVVTKDELLDAVWPETAVTRLPLEAQRVLEVASVAGVEFVAAAIAAGLDAAAALVEAHCEALVEQQLLHPLGVSTWPDGTVATRYAFVHVLYQQVLYERLGAGRRVRLNQRLGGRLEAAYGTQAGEVAAELAEHFVRGQNTQRAVHYLHQAAENALHRCANQEAIRLLTKALELLTTLPDIPERSQQELILQTTLGPALIATRGYAAPDVAHTYARARDLCRRVGDTPQLFVALRGLQTFHAVRAELQMALELAEELLLLAQRQHDPTLLVFAHLSLGSTLFHSGAFVQARVHLEQDMALNVPPPEHAPAHDGGSNRGFPRAASSSGNNDGLHARSPAGYGTYRKAGMRYAAVRATPVLNIISLNSTAPATPQLPANLPSQSPQ